ncbi:MAG: amino-acid N-acetyltransferase [Casimicrobiaceae bacterium]|nr:amino-acid N-acetyltransferase [Casimicrobiaceae bacterium]MDW8312928.1 amino-acid N-acetyltransferase [Burkholderiales bacterium]
MTTAAPIAATELSAFVPTFRASAPYIHAFRGRIFVVAFGGEVVADATFPNFIADLNLLASLGIRLVLVHGSRPQIEKLLAQRNMQSRYHRGIRITEEHQLGSVIGATARARARIEAALSRAPRTGAVAPTRNRVTTGNFIVAKPLGVIDGVDMCYTGEVRRIDAEGILDSLREGDIVLLSTLGYSPSGDTFNLTVEEVATQTAIALKAAKLIFLLDTPGVLDEQGKVISTLSTREAAELAQRAPQESDVQLFLSAAVKACENGVARAHLIGRHIDGAILQELFTRDGIGTMVSVDRLDNLRPATIDDVGALLSIIEPLERQGILVPRSRALIEREIDRFILAEHDGQVIGCAALYPFPDVRKGELACLAVSPEYRREGYGERLLHAIEKTARAQGITTLFVLTTRTAQWFTERGFEPGSIADLPEQKQALYNYERASQVYVKHL